HTPLVRSWTGTGRVREARNETPRRSGSRRRTATRGPRRGGPHRAGGAGAGPGPGQPARGGTAHPRAAAPVALDLSAGTAAAVGPGAGRAPHHRRSCPSGTRPPANVRRWPGHHLPAPAAGAAGHPSYPGGGDPTEAGPEWTVDVRHGPPRVPAV